MKSSETLEPETNEQGLRVQGHSIPGEVNIEALRAKKNSLHLLSDLFYNLDKF